MADAKDPTTHACTGLNTPTQKKVNPFTKPKKCMSLSRKRTDRLGRARVNIGPAFERWRAVKAANGLKSDAAVAVHLLDIMKRFPSVSPSPESSDKKLKFCQSEVQDLIEQEVGRAVKRNEAKLQRLIETLQQLDRGVNYESSIQKLEARINIIGQRADAALAYTKKKSSPPSPVTVISSDSEDETMETVPQNDTSEEGTDKTGEVFQVLETTKDALRKMRADNKALTAAIADLREELPSPVTLIPYGSSKAKGFARVIKEKPDNKQEEKNGTEQSRKPEEPKAKRIKIDRPSPGGSDSSKHTASEQNGKMLYPPLPPTAFPPDLSAEAASYSIPQRLIVHIALIKNPQTLSVLWNVEEDDPSAPPMDSYSVFMSVEKVKGGGVFSNWKTIGVVSALPLPICVMIHQYRPGRKVRVAVVGKDKFGRYGPYSKVVTALIPE